MHIKMLTVALLLGSFLIGCGGQGNSSTNQTDVEGSQLQELQVLKKSKMYKGVDYDKLAEAIAKDQGGAQ